MGNFTKQISHLSSGSMGGGGAEGAMPPVKISHKKDGRQRRPHRFYVSAPPYPAAGSATAPVGTRVFSQNVE